MERGSWSRRPFVWLAVLAVLCGAVALGAGGAGAAGAAGAELTVQVTRIEAHRKGAPHLDPRLRGLQSQLRDYRYARYVLKERTSKTGSPGEKLSFRFSDGLEVEITAQRDRRKGYARLTCVVKQRSRQLLRTRVSIRNGGTYLLALPPKGDQRTFLALTIRA